MMKNILILCGGRSAEHEISLMSARYVLSLLDRSSFLPIVGGVDQEGSFYALSYEDLSRFQDIRHISGEEHYLFRRKGRVWWGPSLEKGTLIDLVFPLIHGPGGEDGTLQGLLESLRIPYVGSGVLASALAMNKYLSKKIFLSSHLPVGPFITLDKPFSVPSYHEVTQTLGKEGLFIKPDNLGSSIGVHYIEEEKDYFSALSHAFSHSSRVIIEKPLKGREIECAIVGHHTPSASGVGEIVIQGKGFYSYQAKYCDPSKAEVRVQAGLSEEEVRLVQDLSLRAFQVLGCSGMARVDSFLTPQGLFLNEVNTIPGFTPHSLYPQLWAQAGISPPQLISSLVQSAYEKFAQNEGLSHEYTCCLTEEIKEEIFPMGQATI